MSQYPTGYPQPGGYPPPPQDSQQYGAPDSQQYGAPDSQQYGGYIPRPIQETSQPQIYPPNIPTSTYSDTVLPLLPQQTSNDINVEPSEEEKAQLHYGEAPARQPRRFKTTKKVKLFRGNLVLDCPVPTKLLQEVPRKNDGEFKFMRYTPCTCDPNKFMEEGYTLRQQLYDPPRQTELFIVLTMYNEDEVLFARTFHGVEKNIDHLCSRGRSRTWGQYGWQKVVVCIVSDGRTKINPRTLSYLAAIGVYQEGVAKNQVNDKEVTAHLYEYTTQLSIGADMKFRKRDENSVPIQVLFCLKEKNAKKINSHRWFFNAFGKALNPQVCVLIDVGTKPGSTSIYHLWKAFDINPNLGGACGEIVAMKGRAGVNLLNPLVASQNFEYKMSNILDKPLESVFGYITVLPGAFSAYRYRALQNDKIQVDGKEVEVGPLKSYFLGETQHGGDADIFTANMYLAEDRILCFELVAKRGEAWLLQYVKSSFAETDVPDTVDELISQRRRWLNGSFFAGVYAICHTFSISRSDHSTFRKTLLYIEMFYQTYNLIFSWIALGNFYLAFYILGNSLTDESVISGLWSKTAGDIIFNILRYVYITLLVVQFILAMGNRPQGSKWAYILSITFFSGLMVYMLFAAVWLTYKGVDAELANLRANHTDIGGNVSTAGAIFGNPTFSSIILSVMSTYGLYIVASLLFFDPWHMFNSLAQYLLLVPFYINILNVYAFCNVHDVSWGTKGDTGVVKHDLGSVTTSSDKGTAEVEVPVEAKDINALYQEAVDEIQRPHVEPAKSRSASEKQDDYYKTFRTNIVLAWIITNGALVAAITNSSSTLNSISTSTARANSYMQFVLWSVAGLAAFRFIGSCTYLLIRLFTGNI